MTWQSGFRPWWTQGKQSKTREPLPTWSGRKLKSQREKFQQNLTPAEDIWVKPCMVDVSRNSLNISISIQWDELKHSYCKLPKTEIQLSDDHDKQGEMWVIIDNFYPPIFKYISSAWEILKNQDGFIIPRSLEFCF